MELDTYINAANQQFEEILDEDLFEDGELNNYQAMAKAWRNINVGEWILIRRIDG
tara:strand:+ start:769 stop:933 length:165 start_codon:yes stop_codon:yes gene_type:complete